MQHAIDDGWDSHHSMRQALLKKLEKEQKVYVVRRRNGSLCLKRQPGTLLMKLLLKAVSASDIAAASA